MSCSQFIEHEDYDSSDTLVVIVNGDGTVSVDPETLQRVLNQQCRATISVVKLEDSNEPESQTVKSNSENDENLSEEKEPFCHKVNLVIEGYYPPPPTNMANKSNSEAQLTQADFLDLLSEGLEIPVSQIQSSSNEGYIGDSLIDAFSEMAPEQLKQVETALHSEKAKQILGDDVTSVLDTLKFEDDDWVHLDHCYTSNYGGRKQNIPTSNENIESEPSVVTTKREVIEDPEESLRRLHELDDDSAECIGSKNMNDTLKLKKKNSPSLNRLKAITEGKTTVLKKGSVPNMKTISPKDKQVHIIKAKRKNLSKNDQPEPPSERIIKDDEVDGVKVFKPTKNDKKIVKPFLFNKESVGNVALSKGLTQTKLNFQKKDTTEAAGKVLKKDSADKTSPDIFGPALFSTPDIIKKLKDDKEDEKAGTSDNCSVHDETAEIEKRMSALENGEAILDRIQMQFEKQNEREQTTSVSEDERLLSDLEITDEETNVENVSREMDDSNSELSSRKSSNVDKSESSDKEDGDYEDDPDKLWCICNKPHGNRFMICCDGCDNWYHGSCVGVTRQMGEKMEINGTEWLCPSCRKEKSAKERDAKMKTTSRTAAAVVANKSTNRHSISSSSLSVSTDDASSSATPSNSATSGLSTSASAVSRKSIPQLVTKPSSSHLCIECRKERTMLEARYCGAECIIKYVENKIASMNSQLSEPLPDDQKIIVVDKKRDHRITGMRGPSVSNLAEWLLEHPSYEIVKPSAFPIRLSAPVDSVKPVAASAKTSIPLAAKPKIVPMKSKSAKMTETGEGSPMTTIRQFFTIRTSAEGGSTQKIRKDEPGNNIIIREGNVLRFGSGAKKELDAKLKDKQRQIKLIPLQPLPKPDEPTTKPTTVTTPKKIIVPAVMPEKEKKKEVIAQQPQQTQQQGPKKEKPTPKKELQRQDSKKSISEESDSQTATASSSSVPKGPEPIRANIRNSLTETFLARAKDVANLNVSEAELTSLASKVEEELFNLFKDVGNKYKNKYRSLRFNINDQKNNLFRRVVEKIVTPYELVRLTPEELASAELAQWREREAKHELDMIKKAELENLNQAKVLVVKTHKGELEIESETLPAPVTDIVVPDLQSEDLPGEKPKKSSSTLHLSSSSRDKDRLASSSLSSSNEKSSKIDHGKERDRHKKHERDRHKSSRSGKHRRRSSERRRSRSRRSNKSQEQRDEEKKSNSSGDKEHRKSRKRSRSRSRSGREKKDEKKQVIEVQEEGVKGVDEEKEENAIESTTSTITDTSTILAASAITTTEDEEKLAADLMNSYNPVDVDLSDMEPSSTVIIQTPPHAPSPDSRAYVWKGMLVMPDVAKFQTVLKEVSGNCAGLEEDLPLTIDSVGRIHPDMVWNYISEQKKSGRKEIVVLRFEALDDEQRVSYLSLYSYLSQKNRMAVIGGTGPDKPLKDFYVMTLASHSPVPQVLLPLDGPGFDDYRSHLLLAIIVRNRRKKFAGSSFASLHLKKETYVPTPIPASTPTKVEETESFTPPHSPTSVFVGGQLGDSKPSKNEDDDEPYEPIDEDEEEEKEPVENEDDEPYSPGALEDERTSKSLELQREMDEINRKIEEEKQKIESMSSALPQQTQAEETIELYSPSDQFASKPEIGGDSSNIQLPEDLQNLLNSFSKRTNEMQSSGSFTADPIVDAYKTGIDEGDYADENVEEISFSPQPPDKSEDVDSQPEPETDESAATTGETVEEPKTSRDPRRKIMAGGDTFQTANVTQPPPPGMEEEFAIPPPVTTVGLMEPNTTVVMSDPSMYNVVTPNVPPPFSYATAPSVPPFPSPMLYMTAPPSIYPQTTPLPFTALPPPQLYVPPPTLINHDPSMIPLPAEGSGEKPLKRKAVDDSDYDMDKERDRSSSRRSDSRNRRGGSYYSDSKSRRSDSKSPPPRHKSGYESHHRGYQRDDADYSSSGHSRYGNSKYGRNYQSRSRSGYWKNSGDYSSGHRKYSDRSRRSSSRDRDRDRDRSSRRYESSRSSKDD